jgi:hypothetical protein
MTVKSLLRLLVCPLLLFCSSCSQSSQPPAPASTQPEPTKAAQPAEEVKVHDVTQEDITKIPGITSRNISVAGVKLGDRTRDLDKLLGKPLKTESLPKLYRTAYDNYGIYIDTDRYVGKVISVYINTNYYKKVKGDLSELLAHGKIELLKQAFGENPIRSEPERGAVMWSYPEKGIQFIHLKQAGTASYTLKLVEPQR